MTRIHLAAALALALVTGCSTLTTDIATVSGDLAKLCQAGAPIVAQATVKAPAPTSAAGILLADAQSGCTVDGQVSTVLAAKADTTTPTWLSNVLGGLQTAAELAPIVLPAVTPAS